ncbi:MAG: tRNA (N(6)-L-threonylcarbamoyladenosine(37)-C(2))-methylthiotransferase MtaB [Thermoclostridium sp.]|nr:tRNA (N(6)-L-threonylcarbamoyladenosine(37)-C(2))-methylthiotransferase MtaB [Thermoclostridium sp.]
MKKVAFITLGCKVNTYETEGMKRIFEMDGYEVVEPEDTADVYIINTCTVTHLSDRKSRQMIRRARRMNPQAIIAAVGCYAQVAPEEVSAIEGVNLVVGNNHKNKILSLVSEASWNTLQVQVSIRKELKEYEELWAQSFSGRTRAFLKIQDGCDQFCSYCIIPQARGGIRSRSFEGILDEAQKLADNGFLEIVLTGIHLTSYGVDTGKHSLIDVISSLNDVEGIRRIRLGSLEPLYMNRQMIARMAVIDKLCSHFHLSLQSGCDETLKRMNRRYTTGEYLEIVESLRQYIPNVAITTDIMVGFPGETDEEFERTCSFARTVGFSQIHIFQYSIRKGTKAAGMSDQIPSHTKEERSKILEAIAEKTKLTFRQKLLGTTAPVLFEHIQDGLWEGHTPNYIPVRVCSAADLAGKILPVRLMENHPGYVLGVLEGELA